MYPVAPNGDHARRGLKPLLSLFLLFLALPAFAQQSSTSVQSAAQSAHDESVTKPVAVDYEHPGGRDIEDLNMRGTYLKLPPFSETVIGLDNPLRQDLARHGIGFLDIDDDEFTYNTTTPPVPLAQQTFTGQRPTWKSSHYPMLHLGSSPAWRPRRTA
ncbi:hypothetical protein [Granulicella tundricola]|uniref:hypothetical protein n=1 Tax=Granulicella tundricola TaxID=940615 RepID=UPI0001DB7162|nr:hypothetical protein [Granulicella tundricola]